VISSALPAHRITATPFAQYTRLSRVLDFVCTYRCQRHNHRATVEQVANGRIRFAACCEELLDAIDSGLSTKK